LAPVLSLLQTEPVASALAAVLDREGRERLRVERSGVCDDGEEEERRMRLVYLVLSLAPTVAVVTLAWYVIRAVSVRVVWRETTVRRLDDEPA
jgi:hypothetical protein